LIKSETLL